MIYLREIHMDDLVELERFIRIPGFINLPDDNDLLRERVELSDASFRGEKIPIWDRKYLFVAEDLDAKRVVGTSMIAAQHGTDRSPHFYFEIGKEENFRKPSGLALSMGP